VLLADDGSKNATRARDFAVTVAAATRARITVVYVREPKDTDAQARRKLARAVAAARAAGRRIEVEIAPPVGITNPGRRILATAASRRADMIVVGARGSGLARRLLGSVSSYVVGRAPVSVAVVR
jgi:nucleotide-binding universal stress UspA family protein